jgi:hypothetical protein
MMAKNKIRLFIVLIAVFLAFSPDFISAITFTYIGGTSGSDLSRVESYGIGTIPSMSDHILIPSNSIATLTNQNQFLCSSLLLASNSTLIIKGSILHFSTGVTIQPGATLILQDHAQLLTTMSTWITNGAANALNANGSNQPNVSFPTVAVLGQLVMYPNTKIGGSIKGSNSQNIAPPLILLISGICRIIPFPNTSTSGSDNRSVLFISPTVFQNIRVVAFSGGSLLYGQNQAATASGSVSLNSALGSPNGVYQYIQPLVFDFVLINVNSGGSFTIDGKSLGSQIVTLEQYIGLTPTGQTVPDWIYDQTSLSNTNNSPPIRPQQIIVEKDGSLFVQFANTLSPTTGGTATVTNTHVELWVDIHLSQESNFQLMKNSKSSSTTNKDSTVAIFGLLVADSLSKLSIGSNIVLELSSQQATFLPLSTLEILEFGTFRTLAGTTLFSGSINANIDSTIELYSPAHFVSSKNANSNDNSNDTNPNSLNIFNLKLFPGALLAIGTDLITDPTNDITLNIFGSFFWYKSTHIVSLGTGRSILRPRHRLQLSPQSKMYILNSSSDSADISSPHFLRHTLLFNYGTINLSSSLTFQDNAQIMSFNTGSIIFTPGTGIIINSDRNITNKPMVSGISNSEQDQTKLTEIRKGLQSSSFASSILLVKGNNNIPSLTPSQVETNFVISCANENTDMIFFDQSLAHFMSTATSEPIQVNISIIFSKINIPTEPLYNSTSIFTRPVIFQFDFNLNANSQKVNPQSTYNFVFDNSLSQLSSTISYLLPTTFNNPFLSLSFLHFSMSDKNASTQTDFLLFNRLDWNLHSLRLINTQLVQAGTSTSNNNQVYSLTLSSILKLGDMSGGYSGSVLIPSGTIATGYCYLFTGSLLAKQLRVSYGFFVFSLETSTSSSQSFAIVNIGDISLQQGSFSQIERTLYLPSNVVFVINGTLVVKPGVGFDSIKNLPSAGVGLPGVSGSATENSNSTNGVNSNFNLQVSPTGRLHFGSPSTTNLTVNTMSMEDKSTHSVTTMQTNTNPVVSTPIYRNQIMDPQTPRSNSSLVNFPVSNMGIIDLDKNSQIVLISPLYSKNSSNDDSQESSIVLGDNSLLTLDRLDPQNTASGPQSYISRIYGTNASFFIKSDVVLDLVNVKYIQTNNSSSTTFAQGAFAFSQQSTNIAQPVSTITFVNQVSGNNKNDQLAQTSNATNSTAPATAQSVTTFITPTSNPQTVIQPPKIHVCPPNDNWKQWNILVWTFLGLFLLFLIISIILAIFPVVCLKKHYEKRLKAANSLNRQNRAQISTPASMEPNSFENHPNFNKKPSQVGEHAFDLNKDDDLFNDEETTINTSMGLAPIESPNDADLSNED